MKKIISCLFVICLTMNTSWAIGDLDVFGEETARQLSQGKLIKNPDYFKEIIELAKKKYGDLDHTRLEKSKEILFLKLKKRHKVDNPEQILQECEFMKYPLLIEFIYNYL